MAAHNTGRQKPALLATLPQMQIATNNKFTTGTTLCQKTLESFAIIFKKIFQSNGYIAYLLPQIIKAPAIQRGLTHIFTKPRKRFTVGSGDENYFNGFGENRNFAF
ncbi:MAG: hypothetical protein IJK07_00805 [Bacteroidales bacterium]|nr:hypothetical protein [Bacteroidales bacterium]